MADPIAHSDLTALAVRREGYGLSLLVDKAIEDANGNAALIALAAKFIDVCDELDLDATDAFFQVVDYIDRGDALCWDNEVVDIEVFLGDATGMILQ